MLDADHDLLIKTEMKAEAAHKRVDSMKEDMEIFKDGLNTSLGDIRRKLDNLLTLKDKLLGGAVVVMFFITTAISLYSVFK